MAPVKRIAALWLRVSKDEQHTENQRPALARLMKRRGYTCGPVFESTVSGAKEDRKEVRALLEGAHRGDFDAVFVWSLDRLGRSMFDIIQIVRELDARGCRLVSVCEGWLDQEGPARALLLAIFAWVADFERSRMIERTRAGLDRARRQGKRLGRPPRAVSLAMAAALQGGNLSVRAVARKMGVPASTLRRKMKEAVSSEGAGQPPKRAPKRAPLRRARK